MPSHRAPRQHLPGDAAGGRPGWQGRLLALVENNERQKAAGRGSGSKHWPARTVLISDIEFRGLLHQAASARGMSRAGYVRRAVAAFVAADLGLELVEVAAHMPRPTPDGGPMALPAAEHPRNNPGKWADDGVGFGSWEVARV
jgi:hypothetical protein